jgi:hypothetical protein
MRRQGTLSRKYSALCCRPVTRSGTDNAGCVSVQSPKTQTMAVVFQFRQRHNENNQRKITLCSCRVISTMNAADHIQCLSLDNDQLDAHLFYFTIRPLQTSTCFEHYMLIIRRLNCIDAASSIVLSVSGRPVHRTATDWEDDYVTLRYLTLPYVTLHYPTLPYITLRYLTLPYITLSYPTLP